MRFSTSTIAGLTLLSIIAAQSVRADDVQTHMQKAQTAASAKDWDGALVELDAVIAIDKNNVTAHSGRAMMLIQKKNFPDAITEIGRVLAIDPKNADAYKVRSELYKQSGDGAKAKADFVAYMRLVPDEAAKLEAAAIEATKKEDWVNAVNLWALLSEVRPDDAHTLYERGMALRGSYYTVFLNNTGEANFQENMDKLKADTKASFDAAIKADPKFAQAYIAQDDVAVLNQGLKLMPDNAELLVARADKTLSFMPSDDLKKEAIEDYSHALKTDPKNADAYAGRAEAYYLLSKNDLSFADTTHALEFKPNDFNMFRLRGEIYSAKQDYANEIAEEDRALAIKPGDESIQFSQYLALIHLPDKTRAFAVIGKLIESSPTDVTYRRSRAELYFDQKDYKSATADVDKLLEIAPGNKDAMTLRDKIAAAQK